MPSPSLLRLLTPLSLLVAALAHGATFSVSNTGDNGGTDPAVGAGTGTLRQAIVDANAAGGSNSISFAGIGSCGQRIALGGPLPDIASGLLIDGYTAPGATQNTSATGFNGAVCVVIDGGGGVDHALHASAPGSTLVVDGLAFGGFVSEAIWIQGGAYHVIAGNLFGLGTQGLALKANAVALAVDTGGVPTLFGGTTAAARNLVANSSHAGVTESILGGGLTVQGNILGSDSAGMPAPNMLGIEMLQTCGNPILDNTIVHSVGDGIYMHGGSCSAIHGNRIGIDANGAAAGNGGYGVELDASAAHDDIGGGPGSSSGGNIIAYNTLGGVRIATDAGVDNPIVDDLIYGNGGAAITHAGPNAPKLDLVYATGSGLLIRGSLSAAKYTTYWLEIFFDTVAQADGGARYRLGLAKLQTDVNGNVAFYLSAPLPAPLAMHSGIFVATATNDSSGDTSTFSPETAQDTDLIFADSFDAIPVPMLP